jgi:uncharacterized membrane protein/mono/diheme cytochrome c family protein
MKRPSQTEITAPGVAAPLVLTLALCASLLPAQAQSDNNAKLTSAVRQIFQAKCAECHRPDSGKAKAIRKWKDWRDLEDLKRKYVAEDFALETSTLWEVLTEQDPKEKMPPRGAKGGALTEEQLETIKRWITAGAPVADPPPPSSPNNEPSSPTPTPNPFVPPQSSPHSHQQDHTHGPPALFSWLGKFHPVVVHFPIALLLLAALGEIANLFRVGTWHLSAARFCLWIAAASAIVAATLGWFAAESGSFSEKIGGAPILDVHRWLGIITALLSVAVAALCGSNCRNESARKKWMFRFALFAAAVLVGATGYFGGLLTFGAGHFAW